MANNERLTKRVKKMEEWIAENESGPTLNNMNYLLDMLRNASNQAMHHERNFNTQRQLLSEYLTEKEKVEDWDSWLKEKDDAVQEQQTEEVSVQEEAEGGEEAIEAPKEEKE
tara:strand:- start:3639 stop:3974 length:336 start_codon:yes stop_codon:yes gene_type:complete